MNTIEQLFQLINKIQFICNKNNGIVTLKFYDDQIITTKLKSVNTNFTIDNGFESTITTFNEDINDTNTYDMFNVSDIT